MATAKNIAMKEADLGRVPSDFLSDATALMKVCYPPGYLFECRPHFDEAGDYVMPQWTIFYTMGGVKCKFGFFAPFEFLAGTVRDDPTLQSLMMAVIRPAPLAATINPRDLGTRHGRYQIEKLKAELAEQEARYKD